ncbi:MAG: 4-carboxymuconolactone decarboxylase [Acidimicrobiaceae bacterium]|jgi:AhpD family alkylhydroperoxidase
MSDWRVARVSRDTLTDEHAQLLDLATPPGHDPLATVAVLAHNPALLGPFLGWAAALALSGVLPKREHELIALRAARLCRSTFEWDEHVEYARRAGLNEEEIDRVAEGPEAAGWSEADAALLRAADELHDAHAISEQTWKVLRARHDDAALVEIAYVYGQYSMLSMVANALNID